MKISRCRGCGAAIIWARTERGGRMPLNSVAAKDASGRGLFVLRDKQSPEGPLAIAGTPAMLDAEHCYTSHFATCPRAAEFRGQGRG